MLSPGRVEGHSSTTPLPPGLSLGGGASGGDTSTPGLGSGLCPRDRGHLGHRRVL